MGTTRKDKGERTACEEVTEGHFCESPSCQATPNCVGWSAGYFDPEADRERELHAAACCPAGHYGCECDGRHCPFEGPPPGLGLSDVDGAPEGKDCECGQPAIWAVEWEWEDGGRFWNYYCQRGYEVETRTFRVEEGS
jgi:hypothetical protein